MDDNSSSLEVTFVRYVSKEVEDSLCNDKSFQNLESTIVRDLEGESDQAIGDAERGNAMFAKYAGADENMLVDVLIIVTITSIIGVR
jgi:hypothetical protein